MKITQIEIFASPIKLKEAFIISLSRHDYAENIIVRINTSEGLTGFGECCPFKSINGESMESGVIVGKYLAQNLVHKNPLNMEECSAIMDATIFGNSSIKSAFDIALYDIAAQHAQRCSVAAELSRCCHLFVCGSEEVCLIPSLHQNVQS